ncbi:uncharacterized protein LOC126786415 [Argentina anserina]|uniref:uncharacterized protein LOC126786415 n=1 Tax=Argentina anserina TaxID=57926 RepID=UPI0021768913|nr:uncharacterized protein LOC126786415 [Potentilla anserina]
MRWFIEAERNPIAAKIGSHLCVFHWTRIYISKLRLHFFKDLLQKNFMEKKRRCALVVLPLMLLLMWQTALGEVLANPASGCGCQSCPANGGECRTCIVNQMKFGCPTCVPILRCMARCLWGGSSRMNCTKKCDCGGGTPKPSDCKKCMARCKCSCMSF